MRNISAVSNIGHKSRNEDSYWVVDAQKSDGSDVYVACVCDGMGGLSHGDQASVATISRIRDVISASSNVSDDDIVEAMNDAHTFLKEESAKEASSTGKKVSIGTTATVVLLSEGKYRFVHVGDSRIYHVKADGSFTILTDDHTEFDAMDRYSLVSRDDSGMFLYRGEKYTQQGIAHKVARARSNLTRAVGASKGLINAHVGYGSYEPGDWFFVCSDGFWHGMEDKFGLKSAYNVRDGQLPVSFVESAQSDPRYLPELVEGFVARLAGKNRKSDNLTSVFVFPEV